MKNTYKKLTWASKAVMFAVAGYVSSLERTSAAPDTVIILNGGATDLTSAASYTPTTAPSFTTDILFSASNTYPVPGILTANTSITTGTINDANTTPLTITNNGVVADTLSISALPGTNNTVGTGAASANDVIFVKGGSNLTFANGLNALTVAFTTGGNIDNAGTLGLSSAINIANGATITLTGAGATTVSGSIAATSGQIVVNDAGGRVILSGTNLYTGGTTVNAGTLVIGSAGALGTGTVVNNATLETTATTSLGSAPVKINVNNTFTQSGTGTLQFQVVTNQGRPTTQAAAGVNYDTLAATGNVSVAGALKLNFQALSAPTQGQRFQLISSLASNVTGTTAATVTGAINPLYIPITTYNDTFGGTYAANNVVVTLFEPFTDFSGLTHNQVAVATNVDRNITLLAPINNMGTPTGAGKDFYDNIVTGLTTASFTPGALGAALDELSPQRFEILRNVAFDNYAFDVQSLDSEFARERNGQGGIDTSGFTFNDSALGSQLSAVKGHLLAWSPAPDNGGLLSDSGAAVLGGVEMTDRKEMKSMVSSSAPVNRWNGFVDGGVDLGDLEHNSDVSHQSYTTGRVRGGADYLVSDDFRVGALFGYSHTDADLDNEGSKAHIDSYTPGIFATYANKEGFYANSLFTYTRNDYETDRNVIIPGVNRTATGSPSGDQFGGDIDGGYEFHHNNWTFGPAAGLTYANLGIDSFNESGAGAANLSVNNQSSESLRSRLGGTVQYQGKIGSIVVTPHASAFWQHEFLDGQSLITSQFQGLPAGTFAVQTTPADSDNALLGLGVDAQINKTVTLFIDYQAEAGGDTFFGQAASGGVKIGF